jgi:UDP-N-acetylglucosamine---dolichyl-phosphate N-acetylglucosaminyltransferase
MKVFIVIPAYNEEKKIGHVIKELKSYGYKNILVVDDGSKDRTSQISKSLGAFVVKHLMNMGYGGASITGMESAFRLGADIAIAVDADGQHDVTDIAKVIMPIKKGEAQVVIGARTLNRKEMPWIRRFGNGCLTFLTFLMFGVWTKDSQSGFRAVHKDAWKKMKIKSSGFEYASEMIKEIGRNNIKFAEVPIHVIYSEYSMSKGQSIIGGVRTFWAMMKRRLLS